MRWKGGLEGSAGARGGIRGDAQGIPDGARTGMRGGGVAGKQSAGVLAVRLTLIARFFI